MRCPSCNHDNRDTAKFCEECAASLRRLCAGCGSELRPSAKFCDECGAGVAVRMAATEASGARKVITIVFADLVGSTALHERLDPESARLFMEGYYRAMRGAVEAHGGTVTQLLGDGVKAVFGAPRVAEDDAIRAVRAAVAMQSAFRTLAEQHSSLVGKTGLRIAVNTGEVVANDDSEIIGDPVNVAARLQEQARDGDVVIGESTRHLVAALVTLELLGSFALKGRAEAVTAYRVVSLDRPALATAAAFVGRDEELARITAVYEAAVAAPAARLAVLLGSPGLGKSRLIDELARRLGERATVLIAQCAAAGGATFAPLAEVLRAHLELEAGSGGDALRTMLDAVLPGDATERARVAAGVEALLAGTPASPEETFFVVRRLLTAIATKRPLVLAIDDLQWAEPLLLDLTEHLVQWGAGVPLLVLVAARPELRDARSSLASPGGVVADVVTLGGLDAAAATRLAASVIGAEALPAALAGRVLATSEGNPLFVGELVRMLVYEGALKREGDRWTTTVALADLEMPPTIQALLAARIERLRPEERLVLERAAVVGRHFSRTAILQLLPREAHADLDARLESLRRSELIERGSGWLLGEPVLRFHHALIRDAAYRRLLKNTRAELHGRFAHWLETQAGQSVEHDETIGWHLEQAHQLLRELGPLDEQGRALGERAARALATAGRRALARDDLPPAASLLGRALARLAEGDPARAELALDWCEALLAAGDVGPAVGAIAELGRFAADDARLRAWHTCFLGQLAVLTEPQGLRASADAVAAAAQALTAAGDAVGEAKAHSVHALALARLGMIGACEAALDRALAAARRAHDRRRANAVLAGAPVAALWGPSPVTRASGRCLDVVRVLRITQGAPAVEAVALRCQALLETLRGRGEAARRMIASSRHMVEELGITQRVLEAELFAGQIELLEGEHAAAERFLRTAYDGLREQGLGIDAAQAAALLGRALLALDRADEAEALSHESEALAGDDFKAAIAWRGVRAEALARRGEPAAAVELARAAVAIAAATDDLLDHADARQALAVALRAAGDRDQAEREELRALELWEAKGATLLTERARRTLSFDASTALTGSERAVPERPIRAPVRANAATAAAMRVAAVVAARDVDALGTLFGGLVEVVEHPTGAVFGSDAMLLMWGALLRAQDPVLEYEMLATLGDALALCRTSMSFGALAEGDGAPFGAVQRDEIVLIEVGADGRQRRVELFAPEHLGDAVVRLYERHAELIDEGVERARATARASTVTTLFGTFDRELVYRSCAPDLAIVDHRLTGFGPMHGRESLVRIFGSADDLATDLADQCQDLLALAPDALLMRWSTAGRLREGGGAFEWPHVRMLLLGDDGLFTRIEVFGAEQEPAALARFAELTAPRTPTRRVRPNAATANAARLEAAVTARDADALPALLADDAKTVHHPTGVTYDRHAVLVTWRGLLSAEDAWCTHAPLATLGDLLALARTMAAFSSLGTDDPAPFGAVEMESFALIEVDTQGRRTRSEFFANNRLGDAVARLYERYAELFPPGPERSRAAATARAIATGLEDGTQLKEVLSLDAEFVDHRPLGLGSASGAAAILRARRIQQEVAADLRIRVHDVLDLRPDGFLVSWTTSGTLREGGGAFESHYLMLRAYDDGRLRYIEWFDTEQAEQALARFDEIVGNAAAAPTAEVRPSTTFFANAAVRAMREFERCWHQRDWDGVRATYHPAHRMDDRRRLMRLVVAGDDFLANERMLFDDTASAWHGELLATRGEQLALFRVRFTATVGDSGPMEVEMLDLVEVDANGRRTALVVLDPEDLDAAYAELDARWNAAHAVAPLRPDPLCIPPNTATRANDRQWALAAAADWQTLQALCAPALVFEDRRRGLRTTGGRDMFLASVRECTPQFPTRLTRTLLATAGDRLALERRLWTRAEEVVEIESLALTEVDSEGRLVAIVLFDPDDRRAASVELFERFARSGVEGIPAAVIEVARALNDRDLPRMRAALPDDFVLHDHRRTGLGRIEGADAYIAAIAAILELTTDVRNEDLYQVTMQRHGALCIARTFGTNAEGGEFESVFVRLVLLRGDRFAATEFFELEDLEAAKARFAALRPDPLRIPPNASTRANDRWWAYAEAADWDAVRTLSAAMVFEDRRRLIRISGGAELLLADTRHLWESGWRPTRTLLAIRGDRLSLERMLWTLGDARQPSEIEVLKVAEVDAAGRIAAYIIFDADDRAAAGSELFERWVALGADGSPPQVVEFLRAVNGGDRDTVHAVLDEGFVYHDHRHTRVGRIEGPDAYTLWLATLWEMSPDARIQQLYELAAAAHGRVVVSRTSGTNSEGGEFESVYVSLLHLRDERVAGIELFELEDQDAALARFAELRPDPLHIPPNAATRMTDRWCACGAARDFEAMRTLYAPGVFDDRRRLLRTEGGTAMAFENSRVLWEQGTRLARTLLATAGERLSLERQIRTVWDDDVQISEVETLVVNEVDADGRCIAIIVFDADDRHAASAELFERYVRNGTHGMPASVVETLRAVNEHDLESARAALPDGFVFHDHRRTGVGRLVGVDAYLTAVAALFELSADMTIHELYQLAVAPHGRVAIARMSGTNAEGGAFESLFVRLALYGGDQLYSGELFELDDRDAALARFDELGAG